MIKYICGVRRLRLCENYLYRRTLFGDVTIFIIFTIKSADQPMARREVGNTLLTQSQSLRDEPPA